MGKDHLSSSSICLDCDGIKSTDCRERANFAQKSRLDYQCADGLEFYQHLLQILFPLSAQGLQKVTEFGP